MVGMYGYSRSIHFKGWWIFSKSNEDKCNRWNFRMQDKAVKSLGIVYTILRGVLRYGMCC